MTKKINTGSSKTPEVVHKFTELSSGKYVHGQLGYKKGGMIEWKNKGRHMTIIKKNEGQIQRVTIAGFDFTMEDHVKDDTTLDNGKVIFKIM